MDTRLGMLGGIETYLGKALLDFGVLRPLPSCFDSCLGLLVNLTIDKCPAINVPAAVCFLDTPSFLLS